MNPMKTLMGALPIVAAAFGRKFGVQVLVGGDQAWTNGKTIYIPAIGEDSDAATLAWGYLTHEAGHCRETDMDVYTKTARRDPLTANVLNILEDVRIENAIRRAYPGSRKWLDNIIGWLSSNGRFNPPKKEDPPPKVLASSLLLMARHRYCQQSFLKEDAAKAEEVLRQVFPATFVHRYLGLLTDIPGLNSTADTAELALRIRGLIEEEAEEPPPPEPPGQSGEDGDEGEDAGDDASEPEDAEGEDEGDGDDAGQSEDTEGEDDGDRAGQSGDDEDEDDGNDADQSEGDEGEDNGNDADQSGSDEGEDDGDDAGQSGSDADQDDGQGREALRAVLSAGAGDLPGDTFEEVAKALGQHASPSGQVLMPSREQYDGDHAQGKAALQRVKGESAKLTARLQGLVEASQRTATRTVRRGNRLDPTKLFRVGVKDDRIFARRDEKVAPNTAMHLLVDLSGSMGDYGNYRTALDAAMSLALALEPMNGVSAAVSSFPSIQGRNDQVTRLLSHGDRVNRRAGAFVQYARGGTPMTGALWYAAADLLARREERKVIMVMTDGEPDDFASAENMVQKAAAAGVEMIGVGIGVQVDNLFPVAIRIRSVADLKGQLFGIAEKLLLR